MRNRSLAVLVGLTVFAVAVQGYHPFAEDGGLYIAGVRKLLDPALYPVWTQFVTEHLSFSVFAPAVASVVHATQLRLQTVLFFTYIASCLATLAAAWLLAGRAGADFAGKAGAAALLACWLTLPIAGTSLMLMDPYVTARSLSTPLVLFALLWALDALDGERRGWAQCGIALAFAAVLHPLMGGYGIAAVLLLLVVGSPVAAVRRYGPWLLGAAALLLAGLLESRAPVETPAYVRVVMTRYYWFPFRWHWYEQLGLLGPVAVLVALSRYRRGGSWGILVRFSVWLAAIAVAIAAIFARTGMATHRIAFLQPLRSFQIVYEVMIILLGGWLGERILQRKFWRWTVLLVGFGCTMFYVDRQNFPASRHIEDPWRAPVNPWEQAFVWIRQNTPVGAVFALDAHYISGVGEDAQCFRAIAERSALPDYSKDGGETSITPHLTDAWAEGMTAQLGLDQESDAERAQKLEPLGANWIVLRHSSTTEWNCPYDNGTVKVCRLQP